MLITTTSLPEQPDTEDEGEKEPELSRGTAGVIGGETGCQRHGGIPRLENTKYLTHCWFRHAAVARYHPSHLLTAFYYNPLDIFCF
jgi:hypothetical protein